MERIEELRAQLVLLHSLANDTTENNWRDKRLYVLQTCVRMSDALSALEAEGGTAVGVKALTDDEILEVVKECAPWKTEPQLNDLLTYEKSPPLFPQATYDVPSYRAVKIVRAVERRILSAIEGSTP